MIFEFLGRIKTMRQSQLFGKTLREAPKDEVSANAKLLERGGFIYKTMAGVYDYLPLGFRVLDRVNRVIREEMNAIGGQELFLSALQPKDRWEKTGRWKTLEDIMYQFKDHSEREVGLAATHEEALAEIATRSIFSYRDLPLFVYQIQTKFRDEPRAKSGLIRGREFLMKDLYSFHKDDKDLDDFYWKADGAYRKIFTRCGLKFYVTEASGGTFTKQFTHEYQVLSEAGEDHIIFCEKCEFAQNREITTLKEGESCPKCNHILHMAKSIEVGNIFKLGTKFSEAFGLTYADEKGEKHPVVMGSYGIGPGRLLATIVEVHNDNKGIIWPESVAPFRVHLVELLGKDEKTAKNVKAASEDLYSKLTAKGAEVLYDDRADKSAGEKFADADLIGIPWRVVVSEKTLKEKSVEIKQRSVSNAELVKLTEAVQTLTKK
ncbi:MAG: aminoacyl--tRNA ligase-related protein [Candidatus Sungiibacteriota bacterium]